MPPGSTFVYTCKSCGYYLDTDNHFSCAEEQSEYHPEVHATEYFDGYCDGVENCVICATPIPYEEVYKLYITWCGEMKAEREIEDREEDFNY